MGFNYINVIKTIVETIEIGQNVIEKHLKTDERIEKLEKQIKELMDKNNEKSQQNP